MESILSPLINIYQNATQFERIPLLIISGLVIICLFYWLYKLIFIRPFVTQTNFNEKKSNFKEKKSKSDGKVEISKLLYIYLAFIFPISVIIYMLFV